MLRLRAFVRSARERSDMGRGPSASAQCFSYTVWFSVFWFFLFPFFERIFGFLLFFELFQTLKIV
jgi:hypothetical protein